MRSESVRGGDFLDAHRIERDGGRESESRNSEGRGGKGGGQGTVPGNDDWALWRSEERVGEERTARFLAGALRDSYGLLPARCSQTERYR